MLIAFAVSGISYVLVIRSGPLEAGEFIRVLSFPWISALVALVTTIVFQRNLRDLDWGFSK